MGQTCDVLIIGEAPGAEEDKAGTPFVGQSGRLLREVVADTGLDKFSIAYTNIVRCRPPDNKTPSPAQVRACLPKLQQEIADLDPRLIILLGNTPLKAVLGENGITNWRGTTLERAGRVYAPMFHPAYVLRSISELPTFVGDFDKVVEVLNTGAVESAVQGYRVIVALTSTQIADMVHVVEEAGRASFDTESRHSRPYASDAKMLMISLAVKKPEKTAWVVPVDRLAPKDLEAVCNLLASDKVSWIGHNAKYDQEVLKQGLGIEVSNVVGDTMLASYVLDTTKGRHGLKELAGRHLGMYGYDAPLQDYHRAHPKSDPSKPGGDQSLVPMDVLAPYAALDAIATLELHRVLYKEMTQAQRALYKELLIPVSNALFHMEDNGVMIDPHITKRYVRVYEAVQERQLELMMKDRTLTRFVRDRQATLRADFETKHAGKKTKAKQPVFEFNANSPVQMRELLYGADYFHLKPLGYTDKPDKQGNRVPSTKWDYLEAYVERVPFLQHYHYYSLLGTVLGTYLRPALGRLGADRRMRSSYWIHGTETGRLSSHDPNLQNIPTPEKEPGTVLAALPVKNIFTCSDWGLDHKTLKRFEPRFGELLGPYFFKGGVVLSGDYSGMELRAMASVSGCKAMSEAFARGEDIHRLVSSQIFRVPLDQVTKEMRYKGKWTNWTLLYGGDEHTLYRLYGVPLDEGKRFIKTYYGMFPEIKEFQEKTIEFASTHGYVDSPFGHRRYFPYIDDPSPKRRAKAEREAVNHPIQNAAGYILLMALIVLDDKMRQQGFRTMLVNTVHDQVMADTPLDELDAFAALMKDVMEGLHGYQPQYFPRLSLDWFTCPLVVDIEIGSHYGTLTEYKPEGEE